MSEACIFCRIVAGELGAHFVLEEEEVVAFLDIKPLRLGHVLVVPRAHHVTLPDLPVPLLPVVFGAVRRVADAAVRALGAEGSFVANNNVVSQSVPHLHVHVVPRKKGDGLKGFFWPRTTYTSAEEAAGVAARLREALAS